MIWFVQTEDRRFCNVWVGLQISVYRVKWGNLEQGQYLSCSHASCLAILKLATAELSIHVDNTHKEQGLSLAVGSALGVLFMLPHLPHSVSQWHVHVVSGNRIVLLWSVGYIVSMVRTYIDTTNQ